MELRTGAKPKIWHPHTSALSLSGRNGTIMLCSLALAVEALQFGLASFLCAVSYVRKCERKQRPNAYKLRKSTWNGKVPLSVIIVHSAGQCWVWT